MKTIKYYQQKVPAGWHIVHMFVKNGIVMAQIAQN